MKTVFNSFTMSEAQIKETAKKYCDLIDASKNGFSSSSNDIIGYSINNGLVFISRYDHFASWISIYVLIKNSSGDTIYIDISINLGNGHTNKPINDLLIVIHINQERIYVRNKHSVEANTPNLSLQILKEVFNAFYKENKSLFRIWVDYITKHSLDKIYNEDEKEGQVIKQNKLKAQRQKALSKTNSKLNNF